MAKTAKTREEAKRETIQRKSLRLFYELERMVISIYRIHRYERHLSVEESFKRIIALLRKIADAMEETTPTT